MNDGRTHRGTPNGRAPDASGPRPGEATHPFPSEEEQARIKERLLYIARRRYRFRDEVAEELVEGTLARYVEAYTRYAKDADHSILLIGLLRRSCQEHIRRQICLTAQGNAIRDVMGPVDVPAAMAAGALDEIASRDARKLMLESITELRPKALEALRFLRDGATRIDLLDVIEHLGVSKQSDAAKLSAYRMQFRDILARCGLRL